MNDLLERYLGAVCSYFLGLKKHRVYSDLKSQIQASAHQYDDLEDLLVSYGHPRSVALSYGYRPFIQHIFNPKIVAFIERIVFFVSGIYLFFSTLYYLEQFNCLPFQSTHHVVSTLNMSTISTWLLSHPFHVMGGIAVISVISLIVLDRKKSVCQEINLDWSLEKLYELPHQSHYPSHIAETMLMMIFSLFFICYAIFFSRDIIIQIQHESYQMIHLMTYFFQPFIMIIFFDYVIDMTKKIYTKKYLKYSTLINLFTLISLTIFVVNSTFLQDYLLPLHISIEYTLVNIFIISALIMIYIISLYKLIRNLRSYRSLFRK
ncbi:hypothetical protein [Candidatus Stoquefichus massiliensis]|uniref:hypothetical protein n=1 Tax=Candidatus Stoquefichus massiliensis TaxID=1470350 RepID=UPI000484C06D|nr:hypothetical protein [Candidatus Stoquefichus massiliensis]